MNKKALDRNEHLVVVQEIHPWDGFYDQSRRFLGRAGRFTARKRINITDAEEGVFYGGEFKFIDDSKHYHFYGIKVKLWSLKDFEPEWEV